MKRKETTDADQAEQKPSGYRKYKPDSEERMDEDGGSRSYALERSKRDGTVLLFPFLESTTQNNIFWPFAVLCEEGNQTEKFRILCFKFICNVYDIFGGVPFVLPLHPLSRNVLLAVPPFQIKHAYSSSILKAVSHQLVQ